MWKNVTRQLVLILVASVGVVACAVDDTPEPQAEPQTSIAESALTCTPNSQRCDIGCVNDGGPANEECRIACAPNGQFWITLENCSPGHCQKTGGVTVCVP
jgi:hypothetical protein